MISVQIISTILSGERDVNKLTDLVFHFRHPERNGRKINSNERDAIKKWTDIRNTFTKPFIDKLSTVQAAGNINSSQPITVDNTYRKSSENSEVYLDPKTYIDRAKNITYKGIKVNAIYRPVEHQIKDENGLIIACISEAEGGFDTVNLYDKGIISWGIMQWTIHAGSLQGLLLFIKSKTTKSVWNEIFPNIDIDDDKNFIASGIRYSVRQKDELMKRFRGKNSGRDNFEDYDVKTMRPWAELFARAGRRYDVQVLQMEYAKKRIAEALNEKLGPSLKRLQKIKTEGKEYKFRKYIKLEATETAYDLPVRTYIGSSIKGKMLYVGMWVNNPSWAKIKFFEALNDYEKEYGKIKNTKITKMAQDRLSDIFEQVLRQTTVGNWGDKKAKAKDKKKKSRTEKLMIKFNELIAKFPGLR